MKITLSPRMMTALCIFHYGVPYSQEYLSLLARKGRIEAMQRGRIWFTTRRAIETYRRTLEDK